MYPLLFVCRDKTPGPKANAWKSLVGVRVPRGIRVHHGGEGSRNRELREHLFQSKCEAKRAS